MTMKEKPDKRTTYVEKNAFERYVWDQAKKYMIAVRKLDPDATMNDIVIEVRGALNRSWGWIGKEGK